MVSVLLILAALLVCTLAYFGLLALVTRPYRRNDRDS